MSSPAHLGLGTVQFGLSYGPARAPIRAPDVGRILVRAAAAGVTVLDTAPSYGQSERVLGEQLPRQHGFRLVTKTVPGTDDVVGDLRSSLRLLAVEAVDGLLVHAPDDLLGPRAGRVWAALCEVRELGLAAKIGVSVYHPRQAEGILARFSVDMIQAPFNVFDQRLRTSGLLGKLQSIGVEVHARSVFLQGRLLDRPEQLPAHLSELRDPLAVFRRMAHERGLDPLAAALGFVRQTPGIDVALVGIDTPAQLDQILGRAGRDVEPAVFGSLAVEDERLVDPSRWEKAP